MKTIKKFLLPAMMAFFFASCFGCATNGNYFPSDLSWIKENATKQDDVKRVLGAPYMVGNTSGVPSWTFGYYEYRLIGSSYTKELKFFWNNDLTIKSFSFNSSFPEDINAPKKHH